MIYAELAGGLGNQMFIYAFARALGLMQGLGCTNADLGALLSCYAIVAVIAYLPSGIIADKVRMRTLSWVGFGATAVLTFIYAMLPSIQMLL